MFREILCFCSGLVLSLFFCHADAVAAADQASSRRERAAELQTQGNFVEAYDLYRQLAIDAGAAEPADIGYAVGCLNNLGRQDEIDEFLESAIAQHQGNWRILVAAAHQYTYTNHYGFLIGGEFRRGHHRGGGRWVNSIERDRVRALQLMEQARVLVINDAAVEDHERGSFFFDYANTIMGQRGTHEAWRLQYLSDLTTLPDYDDGHTSLGSSGAPVDAAGAVVLYHVTGTFERAANDGERWRWLLNQAAVHAPRLEGATLNVFAEFLRGQFGVQTLRDYPALYNRPMQEVDAHDSIFSLHTLGEDETIAKLATGVRRFPLPEEFNFISLYRKMTTMAAAQGYQPWDALARIFSDRRQFQTAAECWRRAIEAYGPGHNDQRRKALDQIVGNWARFEPLGRFAPGVTPDVDMVFRNGEAMEFTAREIKVERLLADVKRYLESSPRRIQWQKTEVEDIGRRLIHHNQRHYLGATAATWSMTLDPAPGHADSRVTIPIPVKKPGAYLVTARMKGGNASRIVVWVSDTVLVEKRLDGGYLYFVADGATGEPIADATVDFFGFRQEYQDRIIGGPIPQMITSRFAEFSDENGIVMPEPEDLLTDFQWLITATTNSGRLAYLGFSGVWLDYLDRTGLDEAKAFSITDRPVYRPDQQVRFKLWVGHARYETADTSRFGGRQFRVKVTDPQGIKVMETSLIADEYGGIEGTYDIPADAPLGTYRCSIENVPGGGTFRVEEYKKPEFEVTIDAPETPVMLGETVRATVRADYYFGSPVASGTVKITVQRTPHNGAWYPIAPWDWLYGPGYWWFGADYEWYPGWRDWCIAAPRGWIYPVASAPPELVVDLTREIGPDGTVAFAIDTALAKELYGNSDHRYQITAEVRDASRRTIVGTGDILVARKPFEVYAWVDRGHYRQGDTVRAEFSARTIDNQPVHGSGELTLLAIGYDDNGTPRETPVQSWHLDPNENGGATMQFVASRPGQYRLSYMVEDEAGHEIEGGYIFTVGGEGFDGREFRFNQLELTPERPEYAPGDQVDLRISTERADSTVLLFVRSENGVNPVPEVIRVDGKTSLARIAVIRADMPNFFVEALTVSDGKVHSLVREIVVPPEKRVLDVDVQPVKGAYLPGETATVQLQVRDFFGNPVVGAVALSVYDASLEYISGGSNVSDIKSFFWGWRRHHYPYLRHNQQAFSYPLYKEHEIPMQGIGAFGGVVEPDEFGSSDSFAEFENGMSGSSFRQKTAVMKGDVLGVQEEALPLSASLPETTVASRERLAGEESRRADTPAMAPASPVSVRTTFADTAFWDGSIITDAKGMAEVSFTMPENLTGWKIRAWAMGHGTQVGQGSGDTVTRKNLILRQQAPRFFVEKDEVVLSANIHNYLDTDQRITAVLELDGTELLPMTGAVQVTSGRAADPDTIDTMRQTLTALGVDTVTLLPGETEHPKLRVEQVVEVEAGGEMRVDWRVKAASEGEATVRMLALGADESDGMEQRFPVYVHGMDKMESYSGVIRPEQDRSGFDFIVPEQRRAQQSRLQINYSPSLAGAMTAALPYLAGYPYGCTEQTLNRFVPTVITHKILRDMGLDLAAIRASRTNLNAQEIGDPRARAEQWGRLAENPVFDEQEVARMTKEGLKRLAAMQNDDGGWGWFSGWGERSYPHTTAVVVHGLSTARQSGVAVVPEVFQGGVSWLRDYQDRRVRKLREDERQAEGERHHHRADNLDALIYMILTENGIDNPDMRRYLYRDRTSLSIYAMATLGLALHQVGDTEKLAMVLRNIKQYLVVDDENQTAYLNLPNRGYWWYWYGGEVEAHAFYLKLLARTEPHGAVAAGLVKYLLNNRKHGSYWGSTRDTAYAIEALAEYMRAAGEDTPDMNLRIVIDGETVQKVRITADNLFTFNSTYLVEGEAIATGTHRVELIREGVGPLYFNGYFSYFSLEDFITAAGLEVRVDRRAFKLVQDTQATTMAPGARGQATAQKNLAYTRVPLAHGDTISSGDLVEVELLVHSKNDYEYIVIEDMKAAGFEPVEVQSGYTGNELDAYVEFRDEKVAFFTRMLARGTHSVSYRLRAETPGVFSALPATISAMYAPELRGNSDEIRLGIVDEPAR
jgi:uncharacterized protein YfaS (alpha-2-macroglobulin family)/tetratricopeptide (TPR) repeat protein